MKISELKSRYEEYSFAGQRGWPNTFASGGFSDLGPIGLDGANVVEKRIGTRGVHSASAVQGVPDWLDQNMPTSVLIIGSDNYDGLRRVHTLRASRYLQFYAPFVAETPLVSIAGHCGYLAEVPCEFGGFSVIATQLGTSGQWFTTSKCVVTIHSAKGAAFDNIIFSRNLMHRNKMEHIYKTPRHLAPGDRLDLAIGGGGYAAVKLYIRKLA